MTEDSGGNKRRCIEANPLRSQDYDCVVVVKGGVEYNHTKTLLCYGAPYFDRMFSIQMSESNTGRVVFDDISPTTWELLFPFIVPSRNPRDISRVGRDNFSILLPLFHRFEMLDHAALCEELMSEIVSECSSTDKMVTDKNIGRLKV